MSNSDFDKRFPHHQLVRFQPGNTPLKKPQINLPDPVTPNKSIPDVVRFTPLKSAKKASNTNKLFQTVKKSPSTGKKQHRDSIAEILNSNLITPQHRSKNMKKKQKNGYCNDNATPSISIGVSSIDTDTLHNNSVISFDLDQSFADYNDVNLDTFIHGRVPNTAKKAKKPQNYENNRNSSHFHHQNLGYDDDLDDSFFMKNLPKSTVKIPKKIKQLQEQQYNIQNNSYDNDIFQFFIEEKQKIGKNSPLESNYQTIGHNKTYTTHSPEINRNIMNMSRNLKRTPVYSEPKSLPPAQNQPKESQNTQKVVKSRRKSFAANFLSSQHNDNNDLVTENVTTISDNDSFPLQQTQMIKQPKYSLNPQITQKNPQITQTLNMDIPSIPPKSTLSSTNYPFNRINNDEFALIISNNHGNTSKITKNAKYSNSIFTPFSDDIDKVTSLHRKSINPKTHVGQSDDSSIFSETNKLAQLAQKDDKTSMDLDNSNEFAQFVECDRSNERIIRQKQKEEMRKRREIVKRSVTEDNDALLFSLNPINSDKSILNSSERLEKNQIKSESVNTPIHNSVKQKRRPRKSVLLTKMSQIADSDDDEDPLAKNKAEQTYSHNALNITKNQIQSHFDGNQDINEIPSSFDHLIQNATKEESQTASAHQTTMAINNRAIKYSLIPPESTQPQQNQQQKSSCRRSTNPAKLVASASQELLVESTSQSNEITSLSNTIASFNTIKDTVQLYRLSQQTPSFGSFPLQYSLIPMSYTHLYIDIMYYLLISPQNEQKKVLCDLKYWELLLPAMLYASIAMTRDDNHDKYPDVMNNIQKITDVLVFLQHQDTLGSFLAKNQRFAAIGPDTHYNHAIINCFIALYAYIHESILQQQKISLNQISKSNNNNNNDNIPFLVLKSQLPLILSTILSHTQYVFNSHYATTTNNTVCIYLQQLFKNTKTHSDTIISTMSSNLSIFINSTSKIFPQTFISSFNTHLVHFFEILDISPGSISVESVKTVKKSRSTRRSTQFHENIPKQNINKTTQYTAYNDTLDDLTSLNSIQRHSSIPNTTGMTINPHILLNTPHNINSPSILPQNQKNMSRNPHNIPHDLNTSIYSDNTDFILNTSFLSASSLSSMNSQTTSSLSISSNSENSQTYSEASFKSPKKRKSVSATTSRTRLSSDSCRNTGVNSSIFLPTSNKNDQKSTETSQFYENHEQSIKKPRHSSQSLQNGKLNDLVQLLPASSPPKMAHQTVTNAINPINQQFEQHKFSAQMTFPQTPMGKHRINRRALGATPLKSMPNSQSTAQTNISLKNLAQQPTSAQSNHIISRVGTTSSYVPFKTTKAPLRTTTTPISTNNNNHRNTPAKSSQSLTHSTTTHRPTTAASTLPGISRANPIAQQPTVTTAKRTTIAPAASATRSALTHSAIVPAGSQKHISSGVTPRTTSKTILAVPTTAPVSSSVVRSGVSIAKTIPSANTRPVAPTTARSAPRIPKESETSTSVFVRKTLKRSDVNGKL